MKTLALALGLALAGCAANSAPAPRGDGPQARGIAAPSRIVATEIAFARAAREEGQWSAFRDYAADDAVMFVPQAVSAGSWLKGRADPAQAVAWQPHAVWMSCDGSLAVSTGAAQYPDGSSGYFTTVWQRQKDGEYRWIMDAGGTLAEPLKEPEFVDAQVAACGGLPPIAAAPDRAGGSTYGYVSDDRTLSVGARVDPWCGRIVTANLFRGNASDDDPPGAVRGSEQVLSQSEPPPRSADGAPPPPACATQ